MGGERAVHIRTKGELRAGQLLQPELTDLLTALEVGDHTLGLFKLLLKPVDLNMAVQWVWDLGLGMTHGSALSSRSF